VHVRPTPRHRFLRHVNCLLGQTHRFWIQ
jgi:hypothetical protein